VNLIITGNPGVGKHTTADVFMKDNSEYQLIDISRFAIEKGFTKKSEDGFEVDTTRLKDELQKLISKKTLFVGH